MKALKKFILALFPRIYYRLRDNYQLRKFNSNGSMKALMADAETANSREALLVFTDKWLKSYQIPFEIFSLVDSLNQLQPKSFMEIGMCDGGTHYLIRKLCPSIRQSVAVDPDIRNKAIIQ